MTARRYDTRHLVLGAALFVYLTAELFPVGAQSELATGLGTSSSRVGLLLSVYAVVAGAATLPLLAVSRRYDQRTVLVVGLVILALSQLGFAFADGIGAAMLWRGLAAAAHGIVWSQATVVAAALAAPDRIARANATVFAGSALALVAGTPLTAALAQAGGWRTTSVLIGVAAGACAVALRVLLPPIPAPAHRVSAVESGKVGIRNEIGAIASVGLITVLMVTGHYVSYAFVEPILMHGGLGRSHVAPMLAAYGIAGLLGVWLTGRYLDKYPTRVRFAVIGGMTVALSAVALQVPVSVGAGIAVWGMAAAAMPVALNTAALHATAHRRDVASGVYVLAYQVGIAGGSALGAVLFTSSALVWLPLTSMALVLASGWIPAGVSMVAWRSRP